MSGARRVSVFVVAVAGGLLLAAPVGAETLTVNKLGDHDPGGCTNADCTLREAVIEANADPDEDRVELPGAGPYKLTRPPDPMAVGELSGDLDVLAPLLVVHPGSGRATIGAAEAGDRAFDSEATLRLRALVIRNGDAEPGTSGGAIFTRSDLSVSRSRIESSETGMRGGGIAVAQGADLTLRRSTVAGNVAQRGGGIDMTGSKGGDGKLRMVASTVQNNGTFSGIGLMAGNGAGILYESSLQGRIKATTLSGNEAAEDGGGIFVAGGSELRIVNSTIAGNRADGTGGGLSVDPDAVLELNAVTVARNRADGDDNSVGSGGGVFANGGADVAFVENTLLARNRTTADAFQDCDAPAPLGIASAGGNLLTTDTDCPFFDHAGDILDPQPEIGPLADNGGPTETIALLAGSPAIDEALASAPGRDQRGVIRVDPDIGAFERD